MIKAKVVVDNILWKKKIKNPNLFIKKRLKKLSKISYFKNKKQEFTILLTNNKRMKFLNYKFRKKNKITDVLSFPFTNKLKINSYLGDIALSYEIINRRSIKTSFYREFDRMWVHGYLHLLGHDHKKIKDFKKMNGKEKIILNHFSKKKIDFKIK
tara:strand:- start:827 stop:1291 length:465 start_codon:yes stop_codon:yes gene_type:complete